MRRAQQAETAYRQVVPVCLTLHLVSVVCVEIYSRTGDLQYGILVFDYIAESWSAGACMLRCMLVW